MKIGRLESLNSKEASDILDMIAEHWSIDEHFIRDFKKKYFFLKNADGKIFAVSKKIAELQLNHLRINSAGLYIAEISKDVLRLSVEGSQIFGPQAKSNVVEITDEEVRKWVVGEDLENKKYMGDGFVIIKNKDDFFGCGKITENKILNYFPKQRRIEEIS